MTDVEKSVERTNFISRLYWTAYLGYHLRGQARYPFKPLSVIKRDRDHRVRRMVPYAYRWVPYYRETMDRIGLRPSDFKCVDDLAKLPIIENEHLRRDPEYFVSESQPLDRYCRIWSGGSTGAPRTIYQDLRGMFQNKAFTERQRVIITKLLGQRFGYRETRIAPHHGVALQMDRFLKSRGLWPAAVAVQRQELLLSDPLEKNAALVNEFKPDLLQTGGSYLTLMCVNIWRTDEGFHRPKIVVYGADSISDSARRLIEEDLKIPVFSFYGAAEASGIGFDCEQHLGLHLNIDLCPIRIVDGNGSTLPEGDVGDVVVSNLVNRGTVLLNYRLGDIAALLPDQCPCGRSLPLLSYPPGRVDDLIPLPSGRVLHPVLLRSILLDEEVWEFQVVQKTKTCFVISVVPNQECDKEQTKRHIMEKFARAFGEDIVVEVSFVDSIGRTKMGKFRTILSIAQRSTLGLTGDTEKD